MKLYILRHANKEAGNYYDEKLCHQNPPITLKGKLKSAKLIDYFKDIQINKIIVSEYLRAGQTAQLIAEAKGLPIIKDARLNEIDNGIIEQLNDEEIKTKYPAFWNDFFSYSKDIRFPEGENGEEVKARQNKLLDELIKHDKNILLVSHEGYIRLLLCNILGLPVYKRYLFNVDYCGLTEIDYSKQSKAWKIVRINQEI